ncbi:MAG TPA: DUF4112 domain-containing protein [Phenylobacterium sp.]|uniref:DUF4112 domain-containing protein n=1 Tax=Phenylobacterium sp. TaxID=1871053 RepID=UPI002B464C9C|nr:DUF4112 domain-containing protein [Phenylobacterium sp.]HKR88158.1 DUF4112 domain-containing protein [Phenylobacterium sp.]
MDVTLERAHRAWTNAERIKRLSDGLIRIGPWGLGVDGVVAWMPGANVAYSVGAGAILLFEAVQAGAAPETLVRMGLYLTVNTALDGVPVLGWAMDTLFRGHAMAAGALQKDIEKRYGAPAGRNPQRRWRLRVRDVPWAA